MTDSSKKKRPAARYVQPDLIPLTEEEKTQASAQELAEQSTVQRLPRKRPSARHRR